ncbi:MAG TPA: hypothetical protein VMU69_13085 [Bradyrhizobium sp.]|nr:hypothetical protein [Bradyrhizobium sp.]
MNEGKYRTFGEWAASDASYPLPTYWDRAALLYRTAKTASPVQPATDRDDFVDYLVNRDLACTEE